MEFMFTIYHKTSLFFNAAALTFPNVCFRFSSSVFNNLGRPTADKESLIKNILQRTCLIPLISGNMFDTALNQWNQPGPSPNASESNVGDFQYSFY